MHNPASHNNSRPPSLRTMGRVVWSEFGAWGRTALAASALAVLAIVGVGYTIERAARQDIVDARAALQEQVVASLDLPDPISSDSAAWQRFDAAVRERLLGGETVRVKVWDRNGTIIYSDVDDLIGTRFEVSDDAVKAFEGATIVELAEADGGENLPEQDLGELIEFYIPVQSGETVTSVFEIYQTADTLEATLATMRRDVWITTAVGVGLLGAFVGALILANAHEVNRRRRHAEAISDELAKVTEDNRMRMVEALHDDIGQPLYRILYGLQGTRARVTDADLDQELALLEGLVRTVDSSLRSELRLLNRAALQEVGLSAAVEDLVAATHAETEIHITSDVGPTPSLAPGVEAALFRSIQEALFNVRKHAGPDVNAHVDIDVDADGVQASVTDDGAGWGGTEGVGLDTVRRSLEAMGGTLSVAANPGGGTILSAWVPANAEEVQ